METVEIDITIDMEEALKRLIIDKMRSTLTGESMSILEEAEEDYFDVFKSALADAIVNETIINALKAVLNG